MTWAKVAEAIKVTASTIVTLGAAAGVLWGLAQLLGPEVSIAVAVAVVSPLIYIGTTILAGAIRTIYRVCELAEEHDRVLRHNFRPNGHDLSPEEAKLGLRDLILEGRRRNDERWRRHEALHAQNDQIT